MTPDALFSAANSIALLAWILLILLPGRPWITDRVTGLAVPAVLAVLYTALIAANIGGSDGGFSSLPDVAALFRSPWVLLAGWVHYLAFDLLIGTWEARDARQHGMPHLLLVPCLVLTLLFGPAGWLLYLIVRTARGAVR